MLTHAIVASVARWSNEQMLRSIGELIASDFVTLYPSYEQIMKNKSMPFWQRALITVIAMVVISMLIGALWRSVFNFGLPEYVSGVIGGLTAIPLWEFLKRIKAKP